MKLEKLLFIFGLLILAFQSSQGQAFTAMKDETTWRKKIAENAKNTKSLKADFQQEKNLAMLSEKLTSKGSFHFLNGKVRLEYKTPFNYLMIINNGKVTMKEDSKTTQMDMNKNKIFNQINKIIIDCVQGNALNSKDFTVSLTENPTQIKMEMNPLVKGMKDFFKNIIIQLDKKDLTAQKMILNEKGGDNTIIQFSNKQLNASIPESLFVVK